MLSSVQRFGTPWTVCSPPGSSVHGISQVSILEVVVTSFSRGSPQPKDQTPLLWHCRRALYSWATRKKTPNSPPVTATNWWSAAAWVTVLLKNTGNGAVEISTACSQITEHKDILCSHRRRKSVPLLSRTIDIFTVELIKSFGWQSPFSTLLKIITIILKLPRVSLVPDRADRIVRAAVTPAWKPKEEKWFMRTITRFYFTGEQGLQVSRTAYGGCNVFIKCYEAFTSSALVISGK